jgi:hypothetical protein
VLAVWTGGGGIVCIIVRHDVWLAYNVTTQNLNYYATIAASAKVKRAVFGVFVETDERGPDLTFPSACRIMEDAGVAYTIVKYGDVNRRGEGTTPYRLSRGNGPIPSTNNGNTGNNLPASALSSNDLLRVLAEVIDLPRAVNQVFSMGVGNRVDAEVLVYMKSQGWPERVQIGLLLGDFMDVLEAKYIEHSASQLEYK